VRKVLLLEFTGIDAEAGFAEWVRPGHELIRIDPLKDHLDWRLSLDEQARAVDLGGCGHILAACSAAALGARLARSSGAHLILLNPYHVTAQRVTEEFGKLFANLGGDPAEAGPDYDTELLSRRAYLVEQCGGEAAAEFADYLLNRYRAWLRYLNACAVAPPVRQVGKVSVVGPAQVLPRIIAPESLRLSEVDSMIVCPPTGGTGG
jgi:hypothetical protein